VTICLFAQSLSDKHDQSMNQHDLYMIDRLKLNLNNSLSDIWKEQIS
jgi:hypothetical protein